MSSDGRKSRKNEKRQLKAWTPMPAPVYLAEPSVFIRTSTSFSQALFLNMTLALVSGKINVPTNCICGSGLSSSNLTS